MTKPPVSLVNDLTIVEVVVNLPKILVGISKAVPANWFKLS
ncbi:MAG: hypothetical protein NZ772_03925 [Cyanobacteria bacterium]|nr:hypothetical protein [Cyanobacteriota bacterium]MDW8200574.1 hypothetical protein [Cyanobacteriota bacterium SKYGB_h_bin112]